MGFNSSNNSKMMFNKDFFFGAATASHQVEGNTHNNWSEWEKLNADRLSKSVDSRYWWMPRLDAIKREATIPDNYISGSSVDHYHRYEQDLQIAYELGLNAYRFSIEWSRIEPKRGEYIESEILHYKKKIEYMKSLGITPFVTFWHWTHPVWLEQEGGVLSPNFSKYFMEYVEYVLKYLGDDVKYWITVNEPEVYTANGYLAAEWPPAKRNPISALRSFLNLAKVNNQTYELILKRYPNSYVSFSKHNTAFVRGNRSIITTINLVVMKFLFSDLWFLLTKNHFNYIGLNNYTRSRVEGLKIVNSNLRLNDLGWELYPDSVYRCVMELKKYNLPIVITENGLADRDDINRGWYIKEVFKALEKAISQGANLIGYLHWSLLDNFEWSHGYWPKFGLIEVDRETQERKVRKSAIIYANLIKEAKKSE